MARILITGGAGYVGSHCAKALAAAGHEVVVFDNLLFGHREFVRFGPLIEGDVRNGAALDAVFYAYRFDAFMHFAALAYYASGNRPTWQTTAGPIGASAGDARPHAVLIHRPCRWADPAYASRSRSM